MGENEDDGSMKYRKLGKTDIEVSVVSMGCWAIVGDQLWGKQDESESIRTLRAARDAGINFFDTAEGYGNGYSEELLAKAFGGSRDDVVVASKVSPNHLTPELIRKSCEQSLRRLKADTIDLYQVHWPNWDLPMADVAKALLRLQKEGKIRAIGVSNFGVRDLGDFLATTRCESNQLCYNLLWRAIEFEIRQACVDNGIGIICYAPLMQGMLTGKFRAADEVPEGRARSRHFSDKRPLARHGEAGCEELTFQTIDRIRKICDRIREPMADVALAWLLAQPGVTSVIAGARSPAQIKENVRAAELKLSEDVIAELTQATADLKQKLGPNPDLWQSDSRIR